MVPNRADSPSVFEVFSGYDSGSSPGSRCWDFPACFGGADCRNDARSGDYPAHSRRPYSLEDNGRLSGAGPGGRRTGGGRSNIWDKWLEGFPACWLWASDAYVDLVFCLFPAVFRILGIFRLVSRRSCKPIPSLISADRFRAVGSPFVLLPAHEAKTSAIYHELQSVDGNRFILPAEIINSCPEADNAGNDEPAHNHKAGRISQTFPVSHFLRLLHRCRLARAESRMPPP